MTTADLSYSKSFKESRVSCYKSYNPFHPEKDKSHSTKIQFSSHRSYLFRRRMIMKINEGEKLFNGRSWILQRRENDINNSNFRLQKESTYIVRGTRRKKSVTKYTILSRSKSMKEKTVNISLKSRSADGRAINVGRLSLYDPLVCMPSFKTHSV